MFLWDGLELESIMRRHFLFGPLALLLTLVLAGCENPADSKPEAITGPAQPETSAPADPGNASATAPAETAAASPADVSNSSALAFSNANGSTINFVGSKLTGSHDGGFKVFHGSVELASDRPEIVKISADIDMDSLWSDADKLTAHLKTPDFFDVPKYPKATFVTTEIKPGGDKDATHTITGNLTLHGVTKSITFPATLSVTDGEATIRSEFFIKKSDFGMTYGGPGNVIRDEVVIKLDVKAPRAKSGDKA